MAYFVADEKLQGYYVSGGVTINIVRYHFECDDAASLPAQTAFISSKNIKISMASTAHTLADNKKYEMNSGGTWVDITENAGAYTLPPATANSLGGVMVGDGLSVTASGLLSGDFSALWDSIYQTEKHLSGVPPLSFMASGNGIESFEIYGSGQQTGTPTPDNPIMPTFCGVRTGNLANLWNVDAEFLNLHYTTGSAMTISISGTKTNGNNVHSIATPNIILPAGKYTLKIKMTSGTITGLSDGVFFGINKDTYSRRTTPGIKAIGEVGTRTLTLSDDTLITSLDITPGYGSVGAVFTNAAFKCGLYAGESAPADYEPFGYKIPISCAGQTVPVYLGEVQTVRRIRKLVLTGEETFNYNSSNHTFYFILNNAYYTGSVRTTPLYCSHYIHIDDGRAFANMPNNSIYIESLGAYTGAYIYSTDYADLTEFTAYIQQQYAAGNPVTIWYVLATPTTGIVNEPLAKIGEYADELSSTDAGVTIPTAKGQNTLTVETDLQPSNMTITYF